MGCTFSLNAFFVASEGVVSGYVVVVACNLQLRTNGKKALACSLGNPGRTGT